MGPEETKQSVRAPISHVGVVDHLALPLQLLGECPLYSGGSWRRQNKVSHVIPIGKRNVLVPAASVPAERVFASAGGIMANKCSDRNPTMLVGLHNNFP